MAENRLDNSARSETIKRLLFQSISREEVNELSKNGYDKAIISKYLGHKLMVEKVTFSPELIQLYVEH